MDKFIKVWTVCPNDFEYSVQHFKTKDEAEAWAKTYESGAYVFENEIKEEIFNFKQKVTAKKGYRL